MATTIRSTALDFDNIKNNLKTFLANKEEFADYNFEASGLSNILDVLAYNTHINALVANFALNESFLSTAQLRSSIVSLAEGVGYIPRSSTSSKASVKISFNSNAAGRPVSVTLPKYTEFNTSVDNKSYTFLNIDDYTAVDDGQGFYEFLGANDTNIIDLYEGTLKTKTFYVGEYIDNPVYIIPDTNLDTVTVSVVVYPSSTSTEEIPYINIRNATQINTQTAVYILKEAPNGFFELSFGDGKTFGIAPQAGNRIEVTYLSSAKEDANNATIFNAAESFTSGSIAATLNVVTQSISTGGGEAESIEAIRKNAPFQYATQNRMVTAEDYSSLILRNYSNLIKDINSWGGEDNLDPEFGAVYVSVVFEDDVSSVLRRSTRASILELARQLQVISFRLRFADPETTYMQLETFFQYNPNQTSLSKNSLRTAVGDTIQTYFNNNTGKFKQAYRRSPLLTLIDDVDPAILSSRQIVKMQKRFNPRIPTLISTIRNDITNISNLDLVLEARVVEKILRNRYNDAASLIYDDDSNTYTTLDFATIVSLLIDINKTTAQTIRYPAAIASPDDDTYIITSSNFTYDNQVCSIKNKLSTNTLQVVTAAGTVLVDNIGSFSNDTVTVKFFAPTSVYGDVNYIKLAALPANQSAIAPERNDILLYDAPASQITAVITAAES